MCTCGAGVRSLDVAPSPLSAFTPAVRDWFERAFEGPTAAQAQAWPAIATGEHVLISRADRLGQDARRVPVGLDRLAPRAAPRPGTRLVYVSPLKALAYDVDRNLRAPLRGIGADLTRRRPHRRHAAEASARRCAATRRTSSSRRPSRCTSCSPRRRARDPHAASRR